jgi:uncharacterized protein YceK
MLKRFMGIALALSLSGCGTIMNFGPGPCAVYSYPHIYGGVAFSVGDAMWMSPLNFILLLLDLPFTLVGDTLTLPVTIITTVTYEEKARSKQAGSR